MHLAGVNGPRYPAQRHSRPHARPPWSQTRQASTGPDTRRSVSNGPTHGRPALSYGPGPRRTGYLSIMPQAWLAISYGPRPRRTRLFIIKNTILNKQRINKIDYYKVGVFVRFVSLMWDVRFSNQL